jgi:hypothetical protein
MVKNMKLGDIVKFKKDHYMSELMPGLCIVDDVRKFQFNTNKPNKYHIKTLNKDLDGSCRMTWINSDEVESISEIRVERLNQLGI